ncbi:NUDIX domain-containing protein [Companilactobacillus huachuanensis]|uniref:NUDIX domain-containing protein n=1 Tax=Companilactobacillus huachuanensis TaxID=2559914 RepID=A0ABW1RL94_9LACO|nr:NUDIX domain-containing protein [Companilactobacillus huachuanensis]
MSLKNSILNDLTLLKKVTFSQRDLRKINEIELLIDLNKNLLRKNNPDIHISASAVAFVEKKIILVRHPYLKINLLPAGHVESSENPLETAIRELYEETGYIEKKTDSFSLIDVNLISIPPNSKKNEKEHFHIDFRYHLKVEYKKKSLAELPVYLIDKKKTPTEFKKYFIHNQPFDLQNNE